MRRLLTLVLLSVASTALGAGESGALFLERRSTPRIEALGGASAALSGCADALAGNPAGLAGLERFSIQAGSAFFGPGADAMGGQLLIANPFTAFRIALSVLYVGTAIGPVYEGGVETGSSSLADVVASAAVQVDLPAGLSIGGNIFFANNDLGDAAEASPVFGLDAGLLWRRDLGETMKAAAGIAGESIGSGVDEDSPAPTSLAAGGLFRYKDLALAVVDVRYALSGEFSTSVGVEGKPGWYVSPRAGVRIGDVLSITGGAGFRLPVGDNAIALDYAFVYRTGDAPGGEHSAAVTVELPALFRKTVYKRAIYEGKVLNIAVSDFDGRGVDASLAIAVSEFLRTDLVAIPAYNVIDRNNMQMIVKEQEFQQTGCTTQECAIQLGKLLNVQKMVIGTVSKVGSKFYVSVKLVSVETSVTELAAEEEASSEDGLRAAVKRIAAQLDPR
jgi:TolB-like protein